MRIMLLSDIHTDFHADEGFGFIKSLKAPSVDLLVVAGDFGCWEQFGSARQLMAILASKFPQVVFVPGNHDYWGLNPEQADGVFRTIEDDDSNVAVLDNKVLELGDKKIVGGTMWFPPPPKEIDKFTARWRDYYKINSFDPWVYEQNIAFKELVAAEVRPGDIVVSHHLPSYKSVHIRYEGDKTNWFYVTEMDEAILEKKPALWFHGHTHEGCDYKVGETRVVCNPYGYPNERRSYNKKLRIDVK